MGSVLNRPDIRLVVVGPEGRINMGFILRLAKNFGINDICVVNPQFDLSDSEVKEFAARGAELLSNVVIKSSIEECLSDVKLSICTTSIADLESDVLRQSVPPYLLSYVLPKTGKIALVFGRESVGLKREELDKCDLVSTLDTGTDYNVLNLSHAIAIYMYEVLRASMRESYEANECDENVVRALRRELEELNSLLNDEKGIRALRNVLFRANPRNPECGALYRVLKKIVFQLKSRDSHT
ncbi:MAG: TrmH family RNA methyltransferase [Zestosphaera sp.]